MFGELKLGVIVLWEPALLEDDYRGDKGKG